MSSYTQYLRGQAIRTGCEWKLKIEIASASIAAFTVGSAFTAQIRDTIEGPVKATLSTAAGSIVRVSDTVLELVLAGSVTPDWVEGSVILDIVRTDLSDDIHLGFDLEIPVRRSITRV